MKTGLIAALTIYSLFVAASIAKDEDRVDEEPEKKVVGIEGVWEMKGEGGVGRVKLQSLFLFGGAAGCDLANVEPEGVMLAVDIGAPRPVRPAEWGGLNTSELRQVDR